MALSPSGTGACRHVLTGIVVVSLATVAGPLAVSPARADEVPRPPSAFASITPGHQIIARALHAGQVHSSADPGDHWSLGRIVRASAGGRDWASVFERMQAAGLIAVNGLSEAVFTYQKPCVLKAVENVTEQITPSRVTASRPKAGKAGDIIHPVAGPTDSLDADGAAVGAGSEAAVGFPASGGGDIGSGLAHDCGR